VHTSTPTAETAAQRAHRCIREGIVTGTLAPGSMLSEATLGAALGVSRTPVRAALLLLEEEGWVTIYPKRGALVRTFTAQDAHELAEARHLLEAGGVRAASPQARAAMCTRLSALVEAQDSAAHAQDRDGFVELCLAYHRGFVEVGGNSLLLEFADRLRNRQAVVLHLSLPTVGEHAHELVEDHRALVAACRRDDVDGFSALLRAHMSDAPRSGLA
jgi:DNA-binding GntR family transcriptional regulator